MGVDNLEGLDKIRTELANQVYEATAEIIQFCIQANILCSLENPENSLLWLYPAIQQILQQFGGYSISFANCMHGGRRNKLTKWWATKNVFQDLALLCDNSHTHAQWNPIQQGNSLVFPTAEEAAYPTLLCKRVVALVLRYAKSQGAVEHETLTEQLPTSEITSHRWILDMLPRGKKLRPLVSEFQTYKTFLTHPAEEPEDTPFFQQQLKGARIVQRQLQWGTIRVVEAGEAESFLWTEAANSKQRKLDHCSERLKQNFDGSACNAEVCTVGIPREPWDFVDRAVQAGHPRSLGIHLSQNVMQMLRRNFESEPYKLVEDRAKFLAKWTARCKELEQKEKVLHENLAEHLKGVLRGKRLLLMQEILEDLQYPDVNLVSDICGGFKLSGWLQKSNVFPASLKRPEQSLESALKIAKGLNHNICKQISAGLDKELAEEVWALTEEELD